MLIVSLPLEVNALDKIQKIWKVPGSRRKTEVGQDFFYKGSSDLAYVYI